jgi:hypothetical protein
MPPKRLRVKSNVIGLTAAVKNSRGVIVEINDKLNRKKFRVQWENGQETIEFSNALETVNNVEFQRQNNVKQIEEERRLLDESDSEDNEDDEDHVRRPEQSVDVEHIR